MAGIHYRSDTTSQLRIGERIPTAVLRERLRQRSADACGSTGRFSFTTFDGVPVTVSVERVSVDGESSTNAFDPPLFA